jgi:hypothetical protein
MTIDGNLISALLIAASGIIGWLYTQTQARSKSLRSELRYRRLLGLEVGRYTYECEQALMRKGSDLPVKRPELVALESEEW